MIHQAGKKLSVSVAKKNNLKMRNETTGKYFAEDKRTKSQPGEGRQEAREVEEATLPMLPVNTQARWLRETTTTFSKEKDVCFCARECK